MSIPNLLIIFTKTDCSNFYSNLTFKNNENLYIEVLTERI